MGGDRDASCRRRDSGRSYSGRCSGNLEAPTVGASLVLTVATESLAVLAAVLAAPERAAWLLVAAVGPFVLGLCFYVFTLARFDMHELAAGHGDHWITGGALAISALAAGKLLAGARALSISAAGAGSSGKWRSHCGC